MAALTGKDAEIAAGPASENRSPRLLEFLHESAESQLREALETAGKALRSDGP